MYKKTNKHKHEVQLVLFLEHQTLCDPRIACFDASWRSLVSSGVRSLRVSLRFWNPSIFGRPLDPISNVIRVGEYPARFASEVRSQYLSCFRSTAASHDVSKHTGSSTSVMVFLSSFHHTMSGLRSVAAMWVGKVYPSDRSTLMEVEGGRCSRMVAISTTSKIKLQNFTNKI